MARKRPSSHKRQREFQKRQRELKKAEKAAQKRERRLGGDVQEVVEPLANDAAAADANADETVGEYKPPQSDQASSEAD